jgi:hypothetical protein
VDWRALQRDGFIADNAAALGATIKVWKGAMLPPIDKAIDDWFDGLTTPALSSRASAGKAGRDSLNRLPMLS